MFVSFVSSLFCGFVALFVDVQCVLSSVRLFVIVFVSFKLISGFLCVSGSFSCCELLQVFKIVFCLRCSSVVAGCCKLFLNKRKQPKINLRQENTTKINHLFRWLQVVSVFFFLNFFPGCVCCWDGVGS